ncbi:MAG: hypothetical protein HYT70_02725 [Candidatus Aenigmarchaeota archaeon]|nr:hypothetical protein [Candidatus Aenigmarchaeota archaeon]
MASWILEDDCLVPDRQIRIDYRGPNPFRLYSVVPQLLRAIWDIRGKDVWEREFRWDITSEPIPFFSRFVIRKTYDNWSKIYSELIMQGKQPTDPNKEGEVSIIIRGILRTESPSNTIIQKSGIYKSLRWLYFRTLYNDVRRNLLQECRIKAGDLSGEIRKALGISPEVVAR